MSVSLEEVLNAGGYDINNPDDAKWLLSRADEWEELMDKADEVSDMADDYQDYVEDCEDNDIEPATFEVWKDMVYGTNE